MPDYSNIIGGPLDEDILKQMQIRSKALNQRGYRTDDNLRMLTNKNCWIKMSSFIDITDTSILPADIGGKGGASDLAKSWVLFGGVLKNGKNLRYGVQNHTGVYGTGGVEELGYRPMPGIESANIESQPPLGAVRSATIKFKAWNLNQLSAIDFLYFRLGCSILLEWGHSIYTDNNEKYSSNPPTVDVFRSNITKEDVLKELAENRAKTGYNYDGMLGIVTNYEWSQNIDGSYDCTIRLTGLGSVIESLKINGQAAMPPDTTKTAADPAATQEINSSLATFLTQVKSIDLLKLEEQMKSLFSTGLDLLNAPTEDFKRGYNSKWMATKSTSIPVINLGYGIFALHVNTVENNTIQAENRWVYVPLWFILAYINNSCIIYDKTKSTTPGIYLDFNPDTNYCLRIPQQISIDPSVCYIDTDAGFDTVDAIFQAKGIPVDKITAEGRPRATALSKIKDFFTQIGVTTIDSTNSARGLFMNYMINVDYVTNILKSKADDKGNVTLLSFLETLMSGISTATGNINEFKVGYNETANTVIIYDGQLVERDDKNAPIKTLPIFGLDSIVREFNLKTEASTKIGSMLAITARNGARNTAQNQDSTAFSAIQNSLEDRLLKNLDTNPTNTASTTNASTTVPDTLIAAGNQFNTHFCKSYGCQYGTGVQVYNKLSYNSQLLNSIQTFYTDAMNIIKGGSGEPDHVAATGILPLALNLTMDGIGGLPLLQSFAVPPERLPAQYKRNGSPVVAFTIAGTNHTIQGNQWTTQIRGLMINVPTSQRVVKLDTSAKKQIAPTTPPPPISPTLPIAGGNGTWSTLNATLKAISAQAINGNWKEARSNPNILAAFKEVDNSWAKSDTVPWCAGFTGYALKTSGLPYLKSLSSTVYKNYGIDVPLNDRSQWRQWDVVVFLNPNDTSQGHVGFLYGASADGQKITVFGGNQSNNVKLSTFSKNGKGLKVIAIRRGAYTDYPATLPLNTNDQSATTR